MRLHVHRCVWTSVPQVCQTCSPRGPAPFSAPQPYRVFARSCRDDLRTPRGPRRSRQGPGGTGDAAGVNASCTTRSTRARRPSSTGARPASSRPAELDAALGAHGYEAELLEEVAREDRAVDHEPLLGRLALGVAVGKGLERSRTAVARLADGGEEEATSRPSRGASVIR